MNRTRRALRATFTVVLFVLVAARIDPPFPADQTASEETEERPWSFAHGAAHRVLCAALGEGLTAACDTLVDSSPPQANDTQPTTNTNGNTTTTQPAFIYDNLLSANLVLSTASLVRRGNVLSLAGLVNEKNETSDPKPREGAPILVPGANATSVVVQAATGIVQLQGISSAFLAFTPEWAAARAAFANVDAAQGANLAEQQDESTPGVLSGRKRRRTLLASTVSAHDCSEMTTQSQHVASRRVLLDTEALRDFTHVENTHLRAPLPAGGDLVTSHPSVAEYVSSILNGVKDGTLNETTVNEIFEFRGVGASTRDEVKNLASEDFLKEFSRGIDDDAFETLHFTSGGQKDANDTTSSESTSASQKKEAKVNDILRQLRDIEPKFDFEISVIVRPIVTTLFWGYASRTWQHLALRIAPQEITPYVYSDPLTLVAADLYPEVAAAYAKSLRARNVTETEIKEKLLAAVNVRFVVTVAIITRQQISIGGGDILRNVFTLTL
jgi:hypothetical protein